MLAVNVAVQHANLPVHQFVAVRKGLPANLAFLAVVKVIRKLFQQPDLFAFFALVKQFELLLQA